MHCHPFAPLCLIAAHIWQSGYGLIVPVYPARRVVMSARRRDTTIGKADAVLEKAMTARRQYPL
jgi:hypothetical protein